MKTPQVFIGRPPIRDVQAKAGAAPLLTIDETAARFRCSRRHVQSEISLGRLRVTKLGRLTRIDPKDIDAYLEARKSGGLVPIAAASSVPAAATEKRGDT